MTWNPGFVVGELSYVPYIGEDVVVDVKVDGRSDRKTAVLKKGTVVDLVLGKGLSGTKIAAPYLRFLTGHV
ncbi:MAG: hypothetical protein U5L96_18055 [Owenweeksia sp.]|nr:hypothetical protein [Owenweeksia sp.]